MDSFPSEFTATHRPLLFLAIDAPPPAPPRPASSSTPPAAPGAPPLASPPLAISNDPFVGLQQALSKTFTSRKGFPLWDSSRGVNNDFHTVLVDKVRLTIPLYPLPS
jgi:hypothetical protein